MLSPRGDDILKTMGIDDAYMDDDGSRSHLDRGTALGRFHTFLLLAHFVKYSLPARRYVSFST
jgi:hypothetical protein